MQILTNGLERGKVSIRYKVVIESVLKETSALATTLQCSADMKNAVVPNYVKQTVSLR